MCVFVCVHRRVCEMILAFSILAKQHPYITHFTSKNATQWPMPTSTLLTNEGASSPFVDQLSQHIVTGICTVGAQTEYRILCTLINTEL